MTTPDLLASSVEAAAVQWQADLGSLAAAQDEVRRVEGERVRLAADLAEAVERETWLEAAVAEKQALLAAAEERLGAALARVAELEAQIGECQRGGGNPEPERRVVGEVTMHPGSATYVSFGHFFRQGEVREVDRLFAGEAPATLIAYSYWPDGSVRHALLSAEAAQGHLTIEALAVPDPRSATMPVGTFFRIDGREVQGQLRRLVHGPDICLRDFTWQAGKLCGEVTLRHYPDGSSTWCVSIDNSLATLDVLPGTVACTWELTIGGTVAGGGAVSLPYRERRIFHSHPDKLGFVAPDLARWKAAGAIPNYAALPAPVSEKTILDLVAESNAKPHGLVLPAMGTPGGRKDIGPLPGWDVLLLLTGDPRLFPVSLKAGEALGLFGAALRDPVTDDPYSIEQHPRATLSNPGDNVPAADRLPPVAYSDVYRLDSEHQPALGLGPWLLTGFQQYHTGLVMLSHFNLYARNWKYRKESLGLIGPAHGTTRAEAWVVRTIAVTAAFAPHWEEPAKKFFSAVLERSFRWYMEVEAPTSPLGIIGRNTDTMDRYTKAGITALASFYRSWQEDMYAATLPWIERMGALPAELVRQVGTWIVGNLLGRCATFGVLEPNCTPYDLPGELKVGGRIRDWETLVRFVRPPDPGVFNPRDPQHYQAIAQAALAAAVSWGLPRADEYYAAMHKATVNAFPDRYAAVPTWLVAPYGG
jgi:hypothetical protein